jgi:HK97 family phage major capsid protein
MAIRPPAGQQYRLTNLIDGLAKNEPKRHEIGISDLIRGAAGADLQPMTAGVRGAFLPSRSFSRGLNTNIPSAGGNLASGGIGEVAAAARPPLILESLGAQVFEAAGTSNFSLPAWRPNTGSGWVDVDSAAPALTMSVESAEASGSLCAARVGYSRRLKQQAAGNFEAVLLAEITNEVRTTVERGLIAGSGSNNEPLGLLNTAGTGTQSFAAALASKAELLAMATTFAAAGNISAARFLVSPADLVAWISAGTVAWLEGEWRLGGIPVVPAPFVAAGKALLLDPTTVAIVYFGPPQIVVDTSSNGKSIRGDTEVVVFNVVDVAIRNRDLVVVGSA